MVPAVHYGPWILVTGAAGFLGYHVVERLLEAGHPVLGLDNLDAFYSAEFKRRNLRDLIAVAKRTGTPFELLQDDIVRLGNDWFTKRDITSVVHLAAKVGERASLRDPLGHLNTNVAGTVKLLEFCRARGVRDVVYASSWSVYGKDSPVPFREEAAGDHVASPYAASKRAGELYCRAYAQLYGLRIASLRLFSVYGPRQRPDLATHLLADAITHGQPIALPADGRTEHDWTYVSDVVDGITGALGWMQGAKGSTYEAFNLGASSATSLARIVELLEQGLGARAQFERPPAAVKESPSAHAVILKAQEAFGYVPKVALEDGISRFVQWFKEWRSPSPRAA